MRIMEKYVKSQSGNIEFPIRVAQVMGIMNSGGVEAVVMNYYRAIDKTKVQFDFFVDETSSFPQREEITRLGGRIYLVPPYSHLFKYIKTLIRLFKQNNYRIVHTHINTLNVFPLFAAWFARVPVRICHNHSTANWGEVKKTLLKCLFRPFNKIFATRYFACGESAGRWMYGEHCFERGNVFIMPNAIDTEKFEFDGTARKKLRAELDISMDAFVVGHVGRFVFAKNHLFLIDIFRELLIKQNNSVLLLIGEGELQHKVEEKVKEYGIEKNVIFAGVRSDVNKLYSVMDVFCLPSFYEGLPVVLMEALSNGLPCVVSTKVPFEAIKAKNIDRVSLEKDAELWSKHIAKLSRTSKATVPEISEAVSSMLCFYLKENGVGDKRFKSEK